jgi:hypothetical protein
MGWAETADSLDAFEAFVALAEIWRRIADLEQSGRGTILPLPTNPLHPGRPHRTLHSAVYRKNSNDFGLSTSSTESAPGLSQRAVKDNLPLGT